MVERVGETSPRPKLLPWHISALCLQRLSLWAGPYPKELPTPVPSSYHHSHFMISAKTAPGLATRGGGRRQDFNSVRSETPGLTPQGPTYPTEKGASSF